MDVPVSTLYDIAAGVLPSLAWLWFWVREDSDHHEPRYIIALAFFAGMIAVGLAIFLEEAAQPLIEAAVVGVAGISVTAVTYVAWSAMEELLKYLLAAATVLYRREDSEPIDPVIYMIVVALGFAAVENALFLMSPSLVGNTALDLIQTANYRFVGATVIHTLSSGAIGAMMGLAFYERWHIKVLYTLCGILLAILLHSCFNIFILNVPGDSVLKVFGFVWIGVVLLLALVEYIKRIRPRRRLARAK
jgi:protease PrsW